MHINFGLSDDRGGGCGFPAENAAELVQVALNCLAEWAEMVRGMGERWERRPLLLTVDRWQQWHRIRRRKGPLTYPLGYLPAGYSRKQIRAALEAMAPQWFALAAELTGFPRTNDQKETE